MAINPSSTINSAPAKQGVSGLSNSFEIDWNNPPDDEIVDFVTLHFDAGKERRRVWELESRQALEWARGEQDRIVYRNENDCEFKWLSQSDERLPWELRRPVSINALKNPILARIAMMVGRGITWRPVPGTSKDTDLASSRIGTKLLQYAFEQADPMSQSKMIDAFWLLLCTGMVVGKVIWDPAAGERESFSEASLENLSVHSAFVQTWIDNAKKALKRGELDDEVAKIFLPTGDLKIEWVPGFDITEPANSRSIDDADWMMHSTFRSMEYLKSRYKPELVDNLRPDIHAEHYRDWLATSYGIDQVDSREGFEHVLVHELWRKSTGTNPNGFLGIVASKQKLYSGPNPYAHGEYPFTIINEFPHPENQWRPQSTVKNNLALQRNRNVLRSKSDESMYRQLDWKIMHEKGAHLKDDAFDYGSMTTEVDDDTISGNKVRAFQLPSLPPNYLEHDQTIRADMQEVMGVHDNTLGKKQFSGQSGRHAALQQEADARISSVGRTKIENGLKRMGAQGLSIFRQFVKREQTRSIVGPNGLADLIKFQGADLRPGRTGRFNVLVTIVPIPDLAQSIDLIDSLTERGFLNPADPLDRSWVRRLMGEALYLVDSDETNERRAASIENEKILNGQDVKVALGDNDGFHIEEHSRFTTHDRFKDQSLRDPKIVKAMEEHIKLHHISQAEKRVRPALIEKIVTERITQSLAQEQAVKERVEFGPQASDSRPSGALQPNGGNDLLVDALGQNSRNGQPRPPRPI